MTTSYWRSKNWKAVSNGLFKKNVAMILDKNTLLEDYPFVGAFYQYGVDESKPLDEQEEEEILVLETICDIQTSSKSDAGGNIKSNFNVYFPFDKNEGIKITRGMIFKGVAYGLMVNGRVISVSPSQLGGVECYVEDLDV